jgi:alpha-beta hydrolase superfamily lysophospholipase
MVYEETLTGHGGEVHLRVWEHDEPVRVVILVHGYGEHIGRYDHVARALGEGGAVVWGLDHVGHGRSDGDRALVGDFDLVVDDLHQLVILARDAHPALPVVMVAHSMGGMIGTRYSERFSGELTGLVLSAPLIGTNAAGALLALDEIPEIPIDVEVLSRDTAVQTAYAEDPLVYHGPFKRPTLSAMANALLEISLDADRVTGPVLWQHGTADQLVPLEDSRRGVRLLRNARVEERHYPGARHEIFNETNSDEVLADTVEFVERVTAR